MKIYILFVFVSSFIFFGLNININSASADCSLGYVTLRVGSRGAEVACLQSIVGVTADGKFGPNTKTAVQAWQATHGLTADGVVGPLSKAAISVGKPQPTSSTNLQSNISNNTTRDANPPQIFIFLSQSTDIDNTKSKVGSDPRLSGTRTLTSTYNVTNQRGLVEALRDTKDQLPFFSYISKEKTAPLKECNYKTFTLESSWKYPTFTNQYIENCEVKTARQTYPAGALDTTIAKQAIGHYENLILRVFDAGGPGLNDESYTDITDTSTTIFALIGGLETRKYTSIVSFNGSWLDAMAPICDTNQCVGTSSGWPVDCGSNRCKKKVISKGGWDVQDVTPKLTGMGEDHLTYSVSLTGGPDLVGPAPKVNRPPTPQAQSGSSLTLTGSGFDAGSDNWVLISNDSNSVTLSDIESDGTNITFTIPGTNELPIGDYNVQLGTTPSDWSDPISLSITTVPVTPTLSFEINGHSSSFSVTGGTSITPEWGTVNATSCSNNWNGDTSPKNKGTESFSASATKTYTISCSGDGGSVSKSITVSVANSTFPLTITKSGSGQVRCNQEGCGSTFPENSQVTLTAVPSTGYRFTGWNGDCSGTSLCTFTMTGAKSVSASFSPIPTPSPVVTLYTKPEPEGNDTSVVLSSGEDITLIWSSTNATSCTFIPQEAEKDGNWSGHAGPVGTSGSITAPVIGDTTFTFTCTGGGGTTSQTIKAVIGESAMNSSSSQLANVIGSVTKNVSITENVISPGKFYFTKWLEEGSSGNEVMELQKFLNNVGYDSGTVDGKFGSRTEEALIRLQIANGLKSDGIVGYEVRSFLNK